MNNQERAEMTDKIYELQAREADVTNAHEAGYRAGLEAAAIILANRIARYDPNNDQENALRGELQSALKAIRADEWRDQ
jgi:hypothetical protein